MVTKNKKTIILAITSLFLVMLVLLGLTYAYYRTRIIGNESEEPSISVQSKKMEIVYEDGQATLSTDGLIEPGFSAIKKFSVKNNGNTSAGYMVVIDNVKNEYERVEDWEYTLSYNGETITGNIKNNPYQVLLANATIEAEQTADFELTINYKKLDTVDQSVDMGKTLNLRVNIEEIPTVLGTEQFKSLVDEKGTITLTGNTVLSTDVWLDGTIQMLDNSVKVIDLNGYTLTVNPDLTKTNANYEGAYSVIAATPLEIKNGTIRRGEDLTSGSILIAYGPNSKVTLNNVIVDGNKVVTTQKRLSGTSTMWFDGAGVLCNQCVSLTINDSEIINNYGTGSGIGVKALGSQNNAVLTINNSIIKDNKLVSSSGQSGSAILAAIPSVNINGTTIENNVADASLGTVDLSESDEVYIDNKTIIKNNIATQAAGLYLRNINYAQIEATIEGNKTTAVDGNGGGVYTLLNDSSQNVILIGATIKNNSAAAGGGVYVNGPASGVPGTTQIISSEITGNVAYGTPAANTLKDGGGAGLYVARGIATIMNVKMENNTSTSNVGNAIVVSHAGRNVEGGKLTIESSGSGELSIIGSVAVPNGYGTLTLINATQNGDIIS